MMLALHGRPSEVDAFSFFLATQLGCTLAVIEQMTHAEYVQWQGYFTAKHAIENQKAVSA